jgi:AbrB family looped-hinge helix DNA binding protein
MYNEQENNHSVDDVKTLRRVQAYTGEKSLTIVLPKSFANDLGITKGDYLKVERNGSRIILEKAVI